MGVCRTEPERVYFHITDEWATTRKPGCLAQLLLILRRKKHEMLADFRCLAALRHFLAFPFSPTGSTGDACPRSRGRFRTDVCPDRRHPSMDHNQRQGSQ